MVECKSMRRTYTKQQDCCILFGDLGLASLSPFIETVPQNHIPTFAIVVSGCRLKCPPSTHLPITKVLSIVEDFVIESHHKREILRLIEEVNI